MWDRTLDGRPLTFRLFGINNQNFVMRDEQTGSWWQQVTGEAVQGPLRGRRLRGIVHDEVSYGIWRAENPGGRVLLPVAGREEDYAPANWERTMKKVKTVTAAAPGDPLVPRAVVVGIAIGGQARAYPFPGLREASPVLDTLGGVPIALVVADDRKSIRVFDRRAGGRTLGLLGVSGAAPLRMVDAETGSTWDFSGRAISGPLVGTQLAKLKALKEYWFDWKTYNPSTSVFRHGPAAGGTAPGR